MASHGAIVYRQLYGFGANGNAQVGNVPASILSLDSRGLCLEPVGFAEKNNLRLPLLLWHTKLKVASMPKGPGNTSIQQLS